MVQEWNREKFMNDKWGRNFLGTPPQGRADYAFIQHILASMNEENGRCAILLPHGVLNRLGEERGIRKNLVNMDKIDTIISIGKNLFYNSPMEACIILCDNNKLNEYKNKIKFIYATDLVQRVDGESYLSNENINDIVRFYKSKKNIDGRVAIVDNNEIEKNDFSLFTKRYIKVPIDNSEYISVEDGVESWRISSLRLHSEYELLINNIVS